MYKWKTDEYDMRFRESLISGAQAYVAPQRNVFMHMFMCDTEYPYGVHRALYCMYIQAVQGRPFRVSKWKLGKVPSTCESINGWVAR